MFRLVLGNSLCYLLTAWFIVSFVLITFSGVAFLSTLLYHMFF